MRKFIKSKIFRAAALIILIAAFIYIVLNYPYFYKQARFVFVKPQSTPISETSNDVSVEKGQSNQLNIPSLGITAPIVEAQVTDGENVATEKDFQEALKTGVVHYPGSASVGQFGNAYLFGHSSDFIFKGGSYKTVFALLPHIEKGAEIVATDHDGQIFHYEVIDSRVVNKDDFSVLDQRENKEKLLTLQTSYPVGTALKRWIVVAKLKE